MRVFSIVRQNRRTYWIGAAIGAAGALGSALIGAHASRSGGSTSNALIDYYLQKSMFDYQTDRLTQLQNTAHQREVEDLKKAGLNPILSASGGNGASSGIASVSNSGIVSTASTADKQRKTDSQLAVAHGLLDAGTRLMQYQIEKQNANSASKQADASIANAIANTQNTASQVALNAENAKYLQASAKKAIEDALTATYVRSNLASQVLLNKTTASQINELTPSQKDLNVANANSTIPRIFAEPIEAAKRVFRRVAAETVDDEKKKRVNSAKDVDEGSFLSPRAKRHLEKIRNY